MKKLTEILFKKGKQYSRTWPYVYYWGCDDFHWIRFYRKSKRSIMGNYRVNGWSFMTISYERGKFKIERTN